MRERVWRVPSGEAGLPLMATVFRPPTDGPVAGGTLGPAVGEFVSASGPEARRPLVVINHGTDPATRLSMGMPVFYWLSRWFVERGYVVALPLRRGYGATGGPFIEGQDSCARPDHATSAEAAADDIAATISYLRTQPFVDPDNIVVVGVSSGGWASLALAASNPPGLRLVVNFAGGRGAYAWGKPGKVCGLDALAEAAGRFAANSRVASIWIYAENDSFFPPPVVHRLHRAWINNGGHAELRLLPSYRSEGHDLVNGEDGWALWGKDLGRFLVADAIASIKNTTLPAALPPATPIGHSMVTRKHPHSATLGSPDH